MGSPKDFVTNGGFETAGVDADNPDGWTFAQVGALPSTGRTTTPEYTQRLHGTYAYELGELTDGAYTSGNYSQITQTVDLTDVDALLFSHFGRFGKDDLWTAEVLIGGVQEWSDAGLNADFGDDANEEIDVGAYSGSQTVVFKLSVTGDAGSPNNRGVWDIDSIRAQRAETPGTIGPSNRAWWSMENLAVGLVDSSDPAADVANGYDDDWAADNNPARPFLAVATDTTGDITVDLGDTITPVSFFGLFNHNFPLDGTLKLQGHTSDAWGAPDFEITLTQRARDMYARFPTRYLRWWRLYWTGITTTVTRVGELWLGDHYELDVNYQKEFGEDTNWPIIIQTTDWGVERRFQLGSDRYSLSGAFDNLTKTNETAVSAMLNTSKGRLTPCAFVGEPNSTGDDADVRICHLGNNHRIGHKAAEIRGPVPFSLVELGYGSSGVS